MYKNILGELLPLHIDSNNFEPKSLPLNKCFFVIVFVSIIKINNTKTTIHINTLGIKQIQPKLNSSEICKHKLNEGIS